MMQISNLCDVIRPWIYPRLARWYGLTEDGGTSSLLSCTTWDFRVTSSLLLSAAFAPCKQWFYLHPIVATLTTISDGPERALDLVEECDGGEGEGEKIAALSNLSVPLGMALPAVLSWIKERSTASAALLLCATTQLVGSELVVPRSFEYLK